MTLSKSIPELFILLYLLIIYDTEAMPSSHKNKACLFSSISGKITKNGIPVSGMILVRVAGSSQKTDETISDESGDFSFPSMFDDSISSKIKRIFPGEFSISQKITIYTSDGEMKIWSGVKRKEEEHAEGKGIPLNVTCELTDPLKSYHVGGGSISTICRWDIEQDVIDTGF